MAAQSICRLPEPPRGRCFDQPRVIRFLAESVAAGERRTDQYVYVGNKADFYLCRFEADTPLDCGIKLRDTDDRDRISAPMAAGSGSIRPTFTPSIRIPRGGRIALEIWNNTVSAQQVTFTLTGYNRYFEGDMRSFNPYAPPIQAGMNDGSTPPGWRDDSFIYVVNFGDVAAGTSLLNQPFRINTDADFIFRAFGAAVDGATGSEVSVRWQDGQGRWRMNAPIPLNLLTLENSEELRPVFTEIHYQAGAAPLFDVVNASASSADGLQLWLVGVKRSKQ